MYGTEMDFPTIISKNDKSDCEKKWGVFKGNRTRRAKKIEQEELKTLEIKGCQHLSNI